MLEFIANKTEQVLFGLVGKTFGSSSWHLLGGLDHANVNFGNLGHFLVLLNTFYNV